MASPSGTASAPPGQKSFWKSTMTSARLTSVAQHRADPASGPRSSWSRTLITFADCSTAFSIAGSTMFAAVLERPAVGPLVTGWSMPVSGSRPPAERKPSATSSDLDALLVERLEHRRRARPRRGRRAPTPSARRSSASRSPRRRQLLHRLRRPPRARRRSRSSRRRGGAGPRSARAGTGAASARPRSPARRRADQQALEAALLVALKATSPTCDAGGRPSPSRRRAGSGTATSRPGRAGCARRPRRGRSPRGRRRRR